MTRSLAHDWFEGEVPQGVALGAGTWLYSAYAFRHFSAGAQLSIGERCGIYNGSFFDLGPRAEVSVGDVTTLVGAVLSTNSQVQIGSYVFMAHEVFVADGDWALPGTTTRDRGRATAAITVGDGAWIGARAVLLPGTVIGEDAVVGAAAVVRGVVPAGSTVVGNPARVVASRP